MDDVSLCGLSIGPRESVVTGASPSSRLALDSDIARVFDLMVPLSGPMELYVVCSILSS